MSNKQFNVYLVLPCMIKFTGVDAPSQVEAIEKVEQRFDYRHLLNIEKTGIDDIEFIRYAEDPAIAANVDVVGDEEFLQSAWYGLDSNKQEWIQGLPHNIVCPSIILWNAIVVLESGETRVVPTFGAKPTEEDIVKRLPGFVATSIQIMDPVVFPNGIPPIPAETRGNISKT